MQARTSGTSADTSPSTDIEFGKFDVFHIGNYHEVGEFSGPFIVTNIVGLTGTTYSWSSAYGDMDASTSTVDRYGETMKLLSQSGFVWDGIAQAGLPLAEYEEKFTKGKRPFHLAAPPVTVGQCVPPPYYTIAVRLWDQEKNGVIVEESRRVYVPQVVQVRWMISAEDLFRTPRAYAPDSTTSTLVYSADYSGDSGALMQETLLRLRSYYPETVNIRFVPFFSNDAATTKFLYIMPDVRIKTLANNQEVYTFGLAAPCPSVQRKALGLARCFLGSMRERTQKFYKDYFEDNTPQQRPFPIPVSSYQMLEVICRVAAHEVGHTLGLVDTYYLDGVVNMHNPGGEDQTMMMNTNTDLRWLFNSHPPVRWRTLNQQYLEFVLPTSE